MNKRFEEKVVLITGAGSGLGRETAIHLASEGATLSLVDKNIETLIETRSLIIENSPQSDVLILEVDVSNEELVKKYVDETVSHFKRIDGFFNNAGIVDTNSPIDEYDSNLFSKMIDINLSGVFFGLKHVLAVMKKQKNGFIVNTASVAGLQGLYYKPGYVASKHGVVGLTKAAAIEYAEFGISVNGIAPGPIATNMLVNNFKHANPENWQTAADKHAERIPAKRLGRPEEVACLVAFLLSGEAAFINGVTIPIDGGQGASQYSR